MSVLKDTEIVPDMFPEAFEAPSLTFNYGAIVGSTGGELTPLQVKSVPQIVIPNAEADSLYTLVFSDPDAPTRSDPTMREFLHWIVINIPGGNLNKGHTVAEYIGSLPPPNTGLHRYVFAAFKQTGLIDPASEKVLLANASTVQSRVGFKVAEFARRHAL
eukprot:Ihof_evm2s945 gene=Ihof_evmTU2s945